MGESDDLRFRLDRDMLVDRIYEIASEPSHLDDFIAEWDRHGQADLLAAVEDADALSRHLTRAEAFLARLQPMQPDLTEYLSPYDRFSALIVDQRLTVLAANDGARETLEAEVGAKICGLTLPEDVLDRLTATVRRSLMDREADETLLRMDLAAQAGAVLLRIQRLSELDAVLVVSTHFQWSAASDALLSDAYGLTRAEREVVRLLVEGRDTKAIAAARETTEGTTRDQIKSIIAKMNLRSQADIVRVAVMLGDMRGLKSAETRGPSGTSNWLDREIWKPFETMALPDGRRLSYHDMGPPGGHPVLLTHMGSCMVRWTGPMLRLAFAHNLRVICPIRAGYGESGLPAGAYDPFDLNTGDTCALLDHLGIARLPLVVLGSDFPLAIHLAATHPGRVSELISLGGRPCLPGGAQVEGRGAWQRFFLAASRGAPRLAEFAAAATMAMSRRIGPAAMLRQLCKDSRADLDLLDDPEAAPVLEANIALMSDKSSQSARAFAREYIAFQRDWSGLVRAADHIPTRAFLADQDPTFDIDALPRLAACYPAMAFEVVEQAGLALIYQHFERFIPIMARAARHSAGTQSAAAV